MVAVLLPGNTMYRSLERVIVSGSTTSGSGGGRILATTGGATGTSIATGLTGISGDDPAMTSAAVINIATDGHSRERW
jgi:hypothetical protein